MKPTGGGANVKRYLNSRVKLGEWSQSHLGMPLSELHDFGEDI